MTAYIYELTNITTNEKYVGSTKSPKRRRGDHISNLRGSRHDNRLLQESFDAYGEDAFRFAIIEECAAEDRYDREQHYIDSGGFTFNLGKHAKGGAYDLARHPRASEIRQNISDSKRGKRTGIKLSAATCEKIRLSKLGEKNYRFTGYYVTPWGTFSAAGVAAEASSGSMSRPSVRAICLNPDRIITTISYGKSPYLINEHSRSVIGLTYRDLGFHFVPKDQN